MQLCEVKLTDSSFWFPTGQVQVEGSPVKIQLLDTAGQVTMRFDDFITMIFNSFDVVILSELLICHLDAIQM